MKWLITLLLAFSSTLVAEQKLLAFAGSSRSGSYNKQLLDDAVKMARQMGASVTVIDLKDFPMPFYDADLEAKEGMPLYAKRLHELMVKSDAILIATPEYNASIPGILKNAIDWVSRVDQNAFDGKRFALMSTSPGKRGGVRGVTHLKAIIETLGGNVIDPHVSIPQAINYFENKDRPEAPLKDLLQALLPSKTLASK